MGGVADLPGGKKLDDLQRQAIADAHRIAFEATVSFTTEALKSAMILNGGAAIAVLAYFGYPRASKMAG